MQNNFESINLIVSIIGQIGAWITIILVFLTLKEMEKQRRESYKPVVVIPRFGLQAEGKVKGDVTVFDDLYRGGVFDEEQQSYRGEESAKRGDFGKLDHVVLYNLGAGAAKDIEIEWKLEFELSDAINNIKEFCYKNSIPLILEIDKENLNVCEKFEPDNSFIVSCSILPGKEQIDYLLPQSVEPSGIRLTLPIIYQKLISLLATTYDNQNPEWSVLDLPITLNIRYRDIGNKLHRNQYRLRIAHHFIVTHAETEVTYFEALFETSQIN